MSLKKVYDDQPNNFEFSKFASNWIFLKLCGLFPEKKTGLELIFSSISEIKFNFQFSLTICQTPRLRKIKIKKYTKT